MATLKPLWGPVQPGTTDTSRYTGATNGSIVTGLWITNTTGAAATISYGLNGTAATAANCLICNFSLGAAASMYLPAKWFLRNTDVIHDIQGTSSAITTTAFGVER